MTENEISSKIIGAAIEVHKQLGPLLLKTLLPKDFIEVLVIDNATTIGRSPIIFVANDWIDMDKKGA